MRARSKTAVAMVHDNFTGPTGMGLMCGQLARLALEEGWELTIIGSRVPRDLRAATTVRRVRQFPRLPAVPQHLLWCAGAAKEIRALDVDLVHVHSPILMPLADLTTCHFIAAGAYSRGVREDRRGIEGMLRRGQELVSLKLDDAMYRRWRVRRRLSFVSAFLRDEYRRLYGEPNGGWLLPPPAPAWEPVDAERRARAKRRWGCRDDRIVAGYLGGNDPRKGLAHALALSQERDLEVLIAGPGSQHVRWNGGRGLGFVDPADFIEACDVVLGPARFDSAPVVMLQALSRGVPIAVSATSGWASAVREHGGGAVWDGSVELAEVVRKAATADQDGCRATLGEFSVDSLRRRLLDAYSHILGSAPRRG